MIVHYSDSAVSFAVLVEHPGGHDGGDFLQEHTVGVDNSGRATYAFELPQDQHNNCSFDNWSYRELAWDTAGVVLDSDDGVWTDKTLKSVVSVLQLKCKEVGVPIPERLLASLEKATELFVTFEGSDLDAGHEDNNPSDDRDE